MLYKLKGNSAQRLVLHCKEYSRTMHALRTDCTQLNDKIADARRYRASLVALAGEKAVSKLDEQNGFTKLVQAIIASPQ